MNKGFFSSSSVGRYVIGRTIARRALALIAVLGFALFGLSACSDSSAPTGPESGDLSPTEQLEAEGKRQSRSCMGCHGPEGISRVSSYPSLAGRSQEYLSEQLKAYRGGERDNPMMTSVARNLSDEAINALSHYYASLPAPEEQ